MPFGYRSALASVALALALTSACQRAPAPPLTEVVVATATAIPVQPADAAWRQAPEFVAPLILQDLVEPRLMKASTTQLRVRALTDGRQLAFRLEWTDDTNDDVNMPHTFSDACAVQLPAVIEPTLPAPQMGEPGRPVEITYWNANWQATVNGRGDSLRDIYPNAAVDHYPFQSPTFQPDSPDQQAMACALRPRPSPGQPHGRSAANTSAATDCRGARVAPPRLRAAGPRLRSSHAGRLVRRADARLAQGLLHAACRASGLRRLAGISAGGRLKQDAHRLDHAQQTGEAMNRPAQLERAELETAALVRQAAAWRTDRPAAGMPHRSVA